MTNDSYPELLTFDLSINLSPTGRKTHALDIERAFLRMRLLIANKLELTLEDVKRMSFKEFLFYYSEAKNRKKAKK